MSETADGDAPHAATGCPFQAWSVAEVLRVRPGVLEDGEGRERRGQEARAATLPAVSSEAGAGPVTKAIAERLRAAEEVALGPLAVRSDRSRGRLLPEETCSLALAVPARPDRIIHSKAFRRLGARPRCSSRPRATTTARA